MRYYVTGAGGFIGRYVVKYLAEQGHDIFGVQRPLYHKLYALPNDVPFEFIHLSAYGNHYDQKDNFQFINSNITDLLHVLESLKRTKCQKFYNVSTSAIQLETKTLYSVSKHFGELMVESYNDPRFVNIRPYSVYGPGEAAHRFIPTVIRVLHTGETIQLDKWAYHDWIHVEDFIKAMFAGHKNIGTGRKYSNLNIVEMLEKISGKVLNYESGKLRDYDTIDWVCPDGVNHRPIYEGLKQTYEALK